MKIKKQIDQKDCGLNIIQAIYHHHYDEWLNLEDLKQIANLSSQGLNIASLVDLGQKFGFAMEAFEVPFDILEKEVEFFIALVKIENLMHYVVFRFVDNYFWIWDSRLGKKIKMNKQDFQKIYAGIVITFKPTQKIKHHPYSFKKHWEYLFKNSTLILWLIVILLISAILAFSSTLFSKIIFDQVLPNFLKNVLTTLTIAFIFLALWRVLNQFLKHYFTKKLVNIIEIDLTYQYFKNYSYGYLKDIDKLTLSDHLRRLNLIPSISLFLGTMIQIIFYEAILLIIATSILLALSPTLFAIIIALGAFLVIITLVCSFCLKIYYDKLLPKQQQEWQLKNEFLASKLTLKKPLFHFFIFQKWQKQFIEFKTLDYKIWFITCVQGIFNLLITFLIPLLITFFGFKQLFNNNLSLGSLMMFLNLSNFFISPLINICDFAFHFKQNKANFKMLEFVFKMPITIANNYGIANETIKKISLKNFVVKFDKTILNINDYTINQSIALQGPNGSGKSVFLKTLANFYTYQGQIILNSNLYKDWNKQNLSQKILWIASEEFLFSGSIWEYLTLNQENLQNNLKQNNAKYKLQAFLHSNNLDFNSEIINNGNNFSVGQRQIILLLKIFVYDFDVLLLDEAFENLSMQNFLWFKKTLSLTNKLVIEVSHSQRYISAKKEVLIEEINTN